LLKAAITCDNWPSQMLPLGPWKPRGTRIQTHGSSNESKSNEFCNLTKSDATVNCFTESNVVVDEPCKPHGFMVETNRPKLRLDSMLNTTGNKVKPPFWAEVSAPRSMDIKRGLPLTTVAVRNIPRHYTMQTLLFEFMALKFVRSIDYLNLPEDKRGGKNRGYAFVNLASAETAVAFKETMDGHTWQHVNTRSRIQQQAAASWALVQGFVANNAMHPMAVLITQDSFPTSLLAGLQRLRLK